MIRGEREIEREDEGGGENWKADRRGERGGGIEGREKWGKRERYGRLREEGKKQEEWTDERREKKRREMEDR